MLLLFIGCRKSDRNFTEQITQPKQSYEELKKQFFNTSTADPEVQKVASDIKKQDSIFKFLPDFVKKNGIPKWDKVLYTVRSGTQEISGKQSAANNTSGSRTSSLNENNSEGVFFIPLQSTTSSEVKAYITAYKHNDSLYTYRLYNRDSLNAVQASTNQIKTNLLNTQAVFGYFEKTINNKDSITIQNPVNGKIKNTSIHFNTNNQQGGRASGANTNATASSTMNCVMTIEVTIEYSLEITVDGNTIYITESLSVTMEITIDCSGGGGGGCGCGSVGDPYSGGNNNNWWNYGTGWPWYNTWGGYDPNNINGWYWWWTGGGYYGGGSSYYDYRSIFDYDTGDEDNNAVGGYDNTSYTDYDPTQVWPTIANIISMTEFVGWGTPGISRNCMSYAKAQIAKKGYTISNYGDPGQTIQVYTAASGVNIANAKNGVGYLLSALQRGIPVIVGVDDQPGSPNPGTDNTTDHFIVIVGSGSDANGNYFTFYDNASGDPSQGTNPNNKLYYDPSTGLIKGKSQTTYASGLSDYIVTMIRKSK